MSNVDQEEVGYAKPPRAHRFSAEHQPARRRGRKPKLGPSNDVLRNIADALMEEVSVSLKGKDSKTKLSHALALRLVKQSVAGSQSEQIKFVQFLISSGIIDFKQSEERLRDEYEGIAKENDEENAILLDLFAEAVEALGSTTEWAAHAASAFLTGVSHCSCGVFDHDQEAVNAIQTMHAQCLVDLEQIAQSKVHVPAPGWNPGLRDRREGEDPDPNDAMGYEPGRAGPTRVPEGGIAPGPLGDDLTAGMIGND